MENVKRNRQQQATILAIHDDVAVLVLVNSILAKHYRVLLAADAQTAVGLAMFEGLRIDLALIGRKTPGVCNSRELEYRLISARPSLGILSMTGSVEDEVIKVRVLGIPKARMKDDFATQVQWALGLRKVNGTLPSNVNRDDLPGRPVAKVRRPPLVMPAGRTMQHPLA